RRNHLCHRFVVMRRDWFFAPCWAVRDHRPRRFQRHDGAEASVEFEQNIYALSNRLPYCFDLFGGGSQVIAADFASSWPERIEFKSAITSADHFARPVRQLR